MKEAAAWLIVPDKPDGRGGSAASHERRQLEEAATHNDSGLT